MKQVPAEYKVTKTVCLPDGDVCYKDCKPTEATRMVDHMECKAKVSLSENLFEYYCIITDFLKILLSQK